MQQVPRIDGLGGADTLTSKLEAGQQASGPMKDMAVGQHQWDVILG